MTREIYTVTCKNCSNEMDIVSPCNMTCPVCGGATQVFKQTMIFKCLNDHLHISNESNPICDDCPNAEKNTIRSFEVNRPAEKKAVKAEKKTKAESIGDEDNRMPEVDTVHGDTIKTRKKRKKKRTTKGGFKKKK